MPATEIRQASLLLRLIDSCEACARECSQHIGALVDECGRLTDRQEEAVLVHLLDLHRTHDDIS